LQPRLSQLGVAGVFIAFEMLVVPNNWIIGRDESESRVVPQKLDLQIVDSRHHPRCDLKRHQHRILETDLILIEIVKLSTINGLKQLVR
jgi:hypothetical protein